MPEGVVETALDGVKLGIPGSAFPSEE